MVLVSPTMVDEYPQPWPKTSHMYRTDSYLLLALHLSELCSCIIKVKSTFFIEHRRATASEH